MADVHRLRLMSLLNEMVRDKGYKGAARVLGIDRRTVSASVRSGVLSGRAREALERALAEGDGKDRDALGRRAEASEKKVSEALRVSP